MEDKNITLLRAAGVANHLKISRSYAYQLIAEGQFDTMQMGKAIAVTLESVERYIERQLKLYDAIDSLDS